MRNRKAGQQGVSLLEVLVALFILAVIGVAVIAGVFTSIKGTDLTRTRITAESLARTELEYVFSQPYRTGWSYELPKVSPTYPTGWNKPASVSPDYSNGYSIKVTASTLDTSLPTASKQKLTADVKYNKGPNPDTPILSIETYQTQ